MYLYYPAGRLQNMETWKRIPLFVIHYMLCCCMYGCWQASQQTKHSPQRMQHAPPPPPQSRQIMRWGICYWGSIERFSFIFFLKYLDASTKSSSKNRKISRQRRWFRENYAKYVKFSYFSKNRNIHFRLTLRFAHILYTSVH